jgi:hypothetical protein
MSYLTQNSRNRLSMLGDPTISFCQLSQQTSVRNLIFETHTDLDLLDHEILRLNTTVLKRRGHKYTDGKLDTELQFKLCLIVT